MLYKKYHRAHISQFKKGKKAISLGCYILSKATITKLVVRRSDTFSTYISIDVVEEDINRKDRWVIIYSDGSINCSIIVSK